MNRKLWRFAAALLPVCFLSAQQPAQDPPQDPHQAPQQSPQTPPQATREGFRQPSPEFMRKITEQRKSMIAHATAINDLAGHIQSLDDARKLVDLVAAEFSKELPPKWVTHSLRERIARAEYESAADPGALIPEQHVADAWNDFAEKIGAPQETLLNAAEIHYLRDAQYFSASTIWIRYEKDIWTIPGVFALGPDGKVANGSRALEAIRLLWLLGNETEDFSGIHAAAQKGILVSDRFRQPEKPPAPGQAQSSFSVARMEGPNPVQQAALHYRRDHGVFALDRAIVSLLKNLLAG
jgi:hypothetical protein